MTDCKADSKTAEPDVPEAFICPITQMMMDDPYIDSDGNSYEKEAILEWLRNNACSPITRNHLVPNSLVPNRVLKDLIEDFRKANGIETADSKARKADAAFKPTTTIDRKPLMLFTLIDVSGSMGSACGQNANGESDGYNRLDLVKHTLNTIITSLTDQDKICIIKFSTVAEMFAQLTYCSESNKKLLIERIKNIQPDGQTNIWDALRLCLDCIAGQGSEADEFNTEVYLLTDGEPNINPPGPIVDTMKNYIRLKLKDVTEKPKISTFGYGYNLDSKLCYDLSQASQGIFGFIPDSTMVGTVFINALSQSLVGVSYDYDAVNSDSKDNVIEIPVFDEVVNKTVAMLNQMVSVPIRAIPDQNVVLDFCNYITTLKIGLEASEGGNTKAIQLLDDLVLDCTDSDDANLGQIFKATKTEYFQKWGKHYLLSVLSAFKKRMCINFKDKAMQNFKSDKFQEEQQRIEDVFIQLPPPPPSMNNQYLGFGRGGGGGTTTYSAPVSMNSYYNSGGGCFAASSLVYVLRVDLDISEVATEGLVLEPESLSSNPYIQLKAVADLRSGMKIVSSLATATNDDSITTLLTLTEVETMVKLPYEGNLHQVGELTLTAYHPILLDSKAQFPGECDKATKLEQSEVLRERGWVYDLVLKNRGLVVSTNEDSILIAATWGHRCTIGAFEHTYFGSEVIVDDIKQLDPVGFAAGLVVLTNYKFQRDPQTMEVQALQLVNVSA